MSGFMTHRCRVAGAIAVACFLAVGPVEPVRADEPASAETRAVVGFGRNEPLMLAVAKIVPPRVEVVYGPMVNQQMLVCWRGGKLWSQVLSDVAAAYGLNIVASARTVTITRSYGAITSNEGCSN